MQKLTSQIKPNYLQLLDWLYLFLVLFLKFLSVEVLISCMREKEVPLRFLTRQPIEFYFGIEVLFA